MINDDVKAKLESYIRRIDVVQADLDACKEDLKAIFNEMKEDNFDIKAVKQVLKLRKIDKDLRAEQDFIVGEYREGLNV